MKFNPLVPELSVSSFSRSLKFYRNLGFRVAYERKHFAFLSLQGSQLMIEQCNGHWETGPLQHPYGRGINLQIEVSDVRVILRRVRKHGVNPFRPLADNWYTKGSVLLGCRELLVQDPDGYLLRFSQDIGRKRIIQK